MRAGDHHQDAEQRAASGFSNSATKSCSARWAYRSVDEKALLRGIVRYSHGRSVAGRQAQAQADALLALAGMIDAAQQPACGLP